MSQPETSYLTAQIQRQLYAAEETCTRWKTIDHIIGQRLTHEFHHDVRNQLTAIELCTMLLTNYHGRLSTYQKQEYLSRLQAASRQLDRLLDQTITC